METNYTLKERTVAAGNAVLFKRTDSKAWQVRVKRETGEKGETKEWKDYSTKETNFDKAKKVAADKYYYMKYRQDQGLPDINKTFKSIANLTLKEIEQEPLNKNNKDIYEDYTRAIKRYFKPCFGITAIHNINRQKLLELDEFRIKKMGRVPSFSTVATHNAALNRVFDTAKDKGYMTEMLKPKLFNNGCKQIPRGQFNKKAYKKLTANLMNFALGIGKYNVKGKQPHKEITKQIRYVLWNYVLFLANTGVRPGKECLALKWSDLEFNSDGDIVVVIADGKTGDRDLVAQDVLGNTTEPLKRLKDMHEDLEGLELKDVFNENKHIFRMQNGEVPDRKVLSKTFTRFLKGLGIEEDSKGRNRTLYSLRHTYATRQLEDHGTDIHLLARQMGTSTKMLDQFYSKVAARNNTKQLSGRARHERINKKATDNEELLQAKLKIAELENQLLKAQINQ